MIRTKDVGILTILLAAYVGTGLFGAKFGMLQPTAAAVWPPSGVALAAMLLVGRRAWPVVFAGAFTFVLLTHGTIGTAVAVAVGNTLETLAGAYLIDALAGGRHAFSTAKRLCWFVFVAMLVTPMSAIIGMTSLIMAGQATWGNFQLSWTSWWLGEATSDLILTPVIVLWALAPPNKWKPLRFLEGTLLIVSLSAVGLVAFGRLLPFAAQHEPLEFLCMPFLVWIAFRFQQRIVASAMVALATIVVGGTLLGYGPFAGDPRDNSLLMLQTFLATLAIVSLVVAAVMTDRRVVERQMLDLAVRDPLTGLANYRKLFEVLGAEISRSRRTGQQFTVLFVDVDGLKQINNRHGHLVGSEVLCKVGEALRSSCRSVDTPARFGGDEFAVILPATGPDGARVVAARVSDWLAEFANTPPVTVSVGAAVFPDDGATPDTLLSVADRLQYQMKSDGYSRLQ